MTQCTNPSEWLGVAMCAAGLVLLLCVVGELLAVRDLAQHNRRHWN